MEPNTQDALARAQRLVEEANNRQIEEDSRERLKRIAAKKVTTGFIFPLAEFEKVFGLQLWGHGLPEEKLTDQQLANRARWEAARIAILNNGNTQVRALRAEMDLHEVRYVGYRMQLFNGRSTDGA